MNDIRLKFRTAVRVTVPVTDGWPDAIACTQSAQTDFSGTVKQTGTPGRTGHHQKWNDTPGSASGGVG
ncbi:hypothetical protein HTY54_05425 [Escherichia coli]|nr:hypothetical protein [Escherichia coli]